MFHAILQLIKSPTLENIKIKSSWIKTNLKQALIKLEKHHIDEAEMKYEEFLTGNLLDKNDVIDDDDQSHHRAGLKISDKLYEQVHVHQEHLDAYRISFEPTDIVRPGAVVSVNGREEKPSSRTVQCVP